MKKVKYLPDKFPIRYAIIISDWETQDLSDEEKLQFYTPAITEMLFRQLLLLLQKDALNEKLIAPTVDNIKFKLMDVEIINIAKLNASPDWTNKIHNGITEIIPETKRSSQSTGSAFDIGLYSYAGAGERPSFFMTHNIIEKYSKPILGFQELIKTFGYIKSISTINFLYTVYEKIKNNKITNFQLYESLARYTKPIYISTPYSKIWAILDDGFQHGIVPLGTRFKKESIIKKYKSYNKKNNYNKEKIVVAICKSWEELFVEEILSLYKMFNFCNNCGKALPFNYQGKYCPDIKGNEKCIRERARKRARKIQI